MFYWKIVLPIYKQGSYTMSPKKNPGLFHDFSRTFSQFSRTKNYKLVAGFQRNNVFITTLRSVALGKINWIAFVKKCGSLHSQV